MNLITGISLIAAFVGGMVALFAPCCITFLLPSYLANIFKNKDKVVWMTLIFGAGIATILVPTALGIRAIGQLFTQWHRETYLIGGVFMILLGVMNLSGRKITIPMLNLTVDLTKKNDPWSVYTLGVFSGITSSCCTPVLAGILTLTFLSPTFFWAALAGLSYVAGMVTPLVILALLLEKVDWTRVTKIRSKTVAVLGKPVLLTEVLAGIIFVGIGILFIYLAATGQIVMESSMVERTVAATMMNLVRWSREFWGMEYLFAGLLVLLMVLMVRRVVKK